MREITLFFFNDTANAEIYTLSLHDALPIWIERQSLEHHALEPARHRAVAGGLHRGRGHLEEISGVLERRSAIERDRKSTRLNSSHANISYAVFCLKKKRLSRSLYTITVSYA